MGKDGGETTLIMESGLVRAKWVLGFHSLDRWGSSVSSGDGCVMWSGFHGLSEVQWLRALLPPVFSDWGAHACFQTQGTQLVGAWFPGTPPIRVPGHCLAWDPSHQGLRPSLGLFLALLYWGRGLRLGIWESAVSPWGSILMKGIWVTLWPLTCPEPSVWWACPKECHTGRNLGMENSPDPGPHSCSGQGFLPPSSWESSHTLAPTSQLGRTPCSLLDPLLPPALSGQSWLPSEKGPSDPPPPSPKVLTNQRLAPSEGPLCVSAEGHFSGVSPSPELRQKLLDFKGLWGSFQNIPKCQTQPTYRRSRHIHLGRGPHWHSRALVLVLGVTAGLLACVLLSQCLAAWNRGKGIGSPKWDRSPSQQSSVCQGRIPTLERGPMESGPQGLERVGWGSTSMGSASRIQDMGCSVPLPVCWGLGMGSSAEAPRGEPLEGRDDAEHLGDVGGCCPFGSLCPGWASLSVHRTAPSCCAWTRSWCPWRWSSPSPSRPRTSHSRSRGSAATSASSTSRAVSSGCLPCASTAPACSARTPPWVPACAQTLRPDPVPTPTHRSLLASVSSAGQDCPQHQQNCSAPLPPLLPALPAQPSSPRLCLQVWPCHGDPRGWGPAVGPLNTVYGLRCVCGAPSSFLRGALESLGPDFLPGLTWRSHLSPQRPPISLYTHKEAVSQHTRLLSQASIHKDAGTGGRWPRLCCGDPHEPCPVFRNSH